MNAPALLFPAASILLIGYLLYLNQRKQDNDEGAARWKTPAL